VASEIAAGSTSSSSARCPRITWKISSRFMARKP
jgi:hypothetical protein